MRASKKELFYDQFSEVWERKINNLETEKRLQVVFKQLLKGINLKGKKFLEVGCGLGYFSDMANKMGAKVTAVDVGKKLIERCHKSIPKAKFFVASASNLPFKDESFNVVLCTEVIEHVENQSKVLTEIFRVLKQGGYLVITTPNRMFKPLFSLLTFLRIRPYRGIEKWFFPWKLKLILSRNDSKIIKEVYFNFIYPKGLFNYFEKYKLLKYLMVNQGYLVRKN